MLIRAELLSAGRGVIRSANLIEAGALPTDRRLRAALNATIGPAKSGRVERCFLVKLDQIVADETTRRGVAITLLAEACKRLKRARHSNVIGLGDPAEAENGRQLAREAERLARTGLRLLRPR